MSPSAWEAAAALIERQALIGAAWRAIARPEQLPPPGDWLVWLILAGRGFGKTRTGAEWAADAARRYPGCRIALVAATFADGRDTMVEGESGLLAVLDESELRGGTVEKAWNRSLGELFLANGSRFKIYSSEKPRQLRGPQHHFAWGDEPTYWLDAHKGTAKDTTWSNVKIGTRLPRRPEWPATFRTRIVMTCTPRAVKLLFDREAEHDKLKRGLMQDPLVHVTRGKTTDNLANLTDEYRRAVVEPMAGTTLGRQELDAELILDVEGALFAQNNLDTHRVDKGPDGMRVYVGIDPATTAKEGSDETGIVVAGAHQRDLYALDDYSGRYTPAQWGRKAVTAAVEWDADGIVYETNQGGDMVRSTIVAAWTAMVEAGEVTGPMPRLIPVHSARGKRIRAEPIAAIFEQGRGHVVGAMPRFESQITMWSVDDDDSPDRLDAFVHAGTALFGIQHQTRRGGARFPVSA